MVQQSNADVRFTDSEKHYWCPESEEFATGDILQSLLDAGWHTATTVISKPYPLLRGRTIRVYQFQLDRHQQKLTVCVPQNPFIERIIAERSLSVVSR